MLMVLPSCVFASPRQGSLNPGEEWENESVAAESWSTFDRGAELPVSEQAGGRILSLEVKSLMRDVFF